MRLSETQLSSKRSVRLLGLYEINRDRIEWFRPL